MAVGTELLLGQVIDTNSAWIGEQLASAGIDTHYAVKVGDNPARIIGTLRGALQRSDAVIVCGGLGPTHDDLTRDAIASVMGVGLTQDPEIEARIRAMFASRGREMPANNLRQAAVPDGASLLAVQPGTAPGLRCPVGDGVIYAVPGVPSEMRAMVSKCVVPELRARSGQTAVIQSRILRTWGASESGLAELLDERITALDGAGNPTIAFLASGIEGLKVRITAKGETASAANALVDAEDARLRELLGELVFGVDDETMESVVLDRCRGLNRRLAVAESLTGGMIGSRLAAIPGASDVFVGSIVSYATEVKQRLLAVPSGPVVSEEAASAMAHGALEVLGGDVSVAVTGVAGPTTQDEQPVGTIWLATSVDGRVETATTRLPGDRNQIRQFSVITALDRLRRRLAAVELR